MTELTLQEGWSFELSGSDASFGFFGLFMSHLLSYERHSLGTGSERMVNYTSVNLTSASC